MITPDRSAVVRHLLIEQLGVRAVARDTPVSRAWAQRLANAAHREQTPHAGGPLKTSQAKS